MATAAKCKICGVAHWSNQRCSLTERSMEGSLKMARAEAKGKPLSLRPTAATFDKEALIIALQATIADLEPDAWAWRAQRARNRGRMKVRRIAITKRA